MSAWRRVPLGEACLKITDGTHHSPETFADRAADRFLYLTSRNVRDNGLDLSAIAYVGESDHNEIYSRCDVRPGDVLLTKDGAGTGNCCINTLGEPFSLLSSVCVLRPRAGMLDPKYLLYFLQSIDGRKQITGQMTGAAIKRIILRTIKQATLPLPSLEEQRRIVAVLDEAFGAIATATANAEKNLANAGNLFESELRAVFEEEAQLRPTRTLGDALRTSAGGTPLSKKKEFYEGGTIPWLLSGEVGQREITAASRYITEAGLHASSAKYYPVNSVLVAMYGATAGEVGILRFCATSNQAVCAIHPDERFVPEYVYYFVRSQYDFLVAQAVGNAQPNISQAKIRELPLPLATVDAQRAAVARLDAAWEASERLSGLQQQKATLLGDLRQSLLHRAFSGEPLGTELLAA